MTANPAHESASPHLLSGRLLAVAVVCLLGGAVVSLLISISVGAVHVPLATVWSVMADHLPFVDTANDIVDEQIVWELRTPRSLLAFVVGAGLSIAGVALQALVRNPLADPYVLGVAEGASLAAVIVIAFGAVAGIGVSSAAFVGAMLSMLAVFVVARSAGGYTPARLLLAGVAMGYLCSAVTSFVQFRVAPQELQSIMFWLLGSLAGTAWSDLRVPTFAVLICITWLLLQGRRLNALSVGEESAVALGVDVRRFRVQLMVVTSILVGAVIAVSGGIGFVGLIVPHLVRLAAGPDHRRLLPLSALLGGVFLVLVDVIARVVAAPSELPLGIFTATAGAPMFLMLMRRSRRVEGGA